MPTNRVVLILLLCAAAFPFLAADACMADELGKRKRELERAIIDRSVDKAMELAAVIAAEGTEEARDLLYDMGLRHSLGLEFYEKLAGHVRTLPGVVEFLAARFASGGAEEQVYAADLLSGIDSPEAAAALGVLLSEENDSARCIAVEALARLQRREGIPPLIDLLEELLGGRKVELLAGVEDALFRLTARQFDFIDEWRNWWAVQPPTFDPKKVFDGAKPGGATGVTPARRENEPRLGELPISSKNFVLVIDTSRTMELVEKADIPGLTPVGGTDERNPTGRGGQMTPDDQKLARFWTRLSMTKRELEKILRQIPDDTVFNLVRFASRTERFKPRSVVASDPNRRAAIEWVQALEVDQRIGTNTKLALEEAFRCDPKTTAIYFLSDGLPSVDGKTNDPPGPILDRVFELNRFRKVRLHTFGFNPRTYGGIGEPNPELAAANEWLRRLARESGGKFTELRVDPSCTPEDPYGEGKGKKKQSHGEDTLAPLAARCNLNRKTRRARDRDRSSRAGYMWPTRKS